MFVKDADPAIVDALAAAGRLERVVDYTHSYPHCWRCGTPLIYWAKPTWFARTSRAQGRAAARERDDRLAPGAHQARPLRRLAREQRRLGAVPRPLLGHAAAGVALRRLRHRHLRRVGRRAGRARRAATSPTSTCTGPRSTTSPSTCPKCEQPGARRVEPVLDAWFDSGAMPAAQFHYPFEHEELFEQRFPADFICEAIDQTRGWFYSLLAVNTLVFDQQPVPQRGVPGAGRRQGRPEDVEVEGQRHRPVDGARHPRRRRAALELLLRRLTVDAAAGVGRGDRRVGALPGDAVEHVLVLRHLREPRRLDARAGDRLCRVDPRARPLGALAPARAPSPTVTEALDGFDALRGAQALERFVDDLSNWYVRRSRPRFWKRRRRRRARDAARVPLAPSRACSRRSRRSSPTSCTATSRSPGESVHLADWPEVDAAARDDALEAEMERARTVVSLGLSARNEAKLKVRQPLRRALVLAARRRRVLRRGRGRGRRRAQREAARGGHRPRGPARLHGASRTSAPSARRLGKQVPLVKDALAAVDGAAVQPRARRATAATTSRSPTARPCALDPDDVEVRAASHEELALAQEGGVRGRASTPPSTTSSAPRASRATSSGCSTSSARPTGLEIADRIRVRLGGDRSGRSRRPPAPRLDRRARCWPSTSMVGRRGRHATVSSDGVDVRRRAGVGAIWSGWSAEASAPPAEPPTVLLGLGRRRTRPARRRAARAARRRAPPRGATRRTRRRRASRCRWRWPRSARRTRTARGPRCRAPTARGHPRRALQGPSRPRTAATTSRPAARRSTPPARAPVAATRGRRRALRRRRSRWRGDGRRGRGCLGREHRARRATARRPRRARACRAPGPTPTGRTAPRAPLRRPRHRGRARRRGRRSRPATRAAGSSTSWISGRGAGGSTSPARLLEVGLDRGADAVAVARRVRVERVGVGAQLLAARREVEDLGLEPTAFTFGDAAGGGLGVADERLRLRLRLLEQLARARLRLVHRVVGGALREQQRALQHVGVFATRRQRHLRPLPAAAAGAAAAAGTGRLAASCSFCVRLSMVTAARSSRSSTSSRS